MKQYIFNPAFSLSYNEDKSVIFTSDMKKVFILGDVEVAILKPFLEGNTIENALSEARKSFYDGQINLFECNKFIDDLINANILVEHDRA